MEEQRKEPTVEELKNYCNQLFQQRNELANQLTQITNITTKIPWLFKVVEFKDVFDDEFVKGCIEELQAILTPAKEEEEKKDEA